MDIRNNVKIAEIKMKRACRFLHNFILDADPRTPEALGNVNEMIDLFSDQKKLIEKYESTMLTIYGDMEGTDA